MKRNRSLSHSLRIGTAAAVLIFSVAAASAEIPLPGQGYPDLEGSSTGAADLTIERSVSTDRVASFLQEWQPSGSEVLSLETAEATLRDQIALTVNSIAQLQSLVTIQQLQIDDLLSRRAPSFSFITDPVGNPLYSFSSGMQSDFTAVPPASELKSTHRFGFGLGMTQELPSAGSLEASVSQSSSATLSDGDSSWAWSQSPSLSLSLSQPLFIADDLIDTSYGDRVLQQARLEQQGTLDSIETAVDAVLLQGLGLLNIRQSLLEGRFLLIERLSLLEKEYQKLKIDYDEGLVSTRQIERQEFLIEQLTLQKRGLEIESASLEASVRDLWGSDAQRILDAVILPSLDRFTSFSTLMRSGLDQDEQLFVDMLSNDPDYTAAQRAFALAELNRSLGSPADAPILGFSLQVSPSYGETADRSFGESFTELFSAQPAVSFSVSLIATDLARKSAALTGSLLDEQLLQAGRDAGDASDKVVEQIQELSRRMDAHMLDLTLGLSDYDLADDALREELIRQQSGETTEDLIVQRMLERTEKAFHVLGVLRELELLTLEIDLLRDRL
jgi:hypothetical protein